MLDEAGREEDDEEEEEDAPDELTLLGGEEVRVFELPEPEELVVVVLVELCEPADEPEEPLE